MGDFFSFREQLDLFEIYGIDIEGIYLKNQISGVKCPVRDVPS